MSPGRIVTENENHNYGVIPLSQVIVESSNVGAIKIGFKVGAREMKLAMIALLIHPIMILGPAGVFAATAVPNPRFGL